MMPDIIKATSMGQTETVNAMMAIGRGDQELLFEVIGSEKYDATTVRAILEEEPQSNPNVEKKDGLTPLMVAAVRGNLEIVQALLRAGANANANQADGGTSLMIASRMGFDEIVKVLLAADADVNAQKRDGVTALIRAAQMGHSDVVETLLAAGADINANNRGVTPLMYSITLHHSRVSEILKQHGAREHKQVKYERDVQHYPTYQGWKGVIMAIKRGFIVIQIETAAIIFGLIGLYLQFFTKIPIFKPQASTSLAVVVVVLTLILLPIYSILSSHLFPFLKEKETTLMFAASQSGSRTVQALLNAGANIEARNKDGMTALMRAASPIGNNTANVQLLLNAGANIDARDNKGMTALMWAVLLHNPDVVEILLANGADVELREKAGRTALDFASKQGFTDIVQLLKTAID